MREDRDRHPWWLDAVGYEVYVASFQDSDGDSWGDLPGVEQRLEYLAWLGVDLVWLTPFYPSPMRDHGYDVADYVDVDPRFGTHQLPGGRWRTVYSSRTGAVAGEEAVEGALRLAAREARILVGEAG